MEIDQGRTSPGQPDADDQRFREVFIGVLSHELRTPLTSIYGGAQLLVGDRITPDARIALAADIASEAERLQRMVEDLLAIARVERGVAEPAEEPILVQHLARAAVDAERRAMPDRVIHLHVVPDLPPARADAGLTLQVLRNLIGHVVRHGPDGQPVIVEVTTDGPEIQVEVVQRGPDLPPDIGRDAFRLFYRAGDGSAHVGGTGIDLYVARILAEAQGGRVWLHPRDRGDTEFGFGLPRYAPEGEA